MKVLNMFFLNKRIKGDNPPLGTVPLYCMTVGFKEHEVEDYERRRYRGLDQRIVDLREKKILKRILKRIDKRSIEVLDIPSGYGRFSNLLLKQGFTLVSCDLSFYMVKRAVESAKGEGLQWGVVADAQKGLPFRRNSFSLILSMRFFHHLHTRQEREFILKQFADLSSRWLILSYYKRTFFHLLQRRLRRKIKKSRTRIRMISSHELREEAAQAGWRVVRSFSLCRGLHAQHIAFLEKS